MLIESFENLFSGYAFNELRFEWIKLWNDFLTKYEPLNELEYE